MERRLLVATFELFMSAKRRLPSVAPAAIATFEHGRAAVSGSDLIVVVQRVELAEWVLFELLRSRNRV